MYRDELFASAMESLGRLEEFEAGGAFEQIINRLRLAESPETAFRGVSAPLLATWPEPPMLRQVVDRLNVWVRTGPPEEKWQPEAMVETLPDEYRKLPMMADLGKAEFSRYDGFALLEAAWMRDVSNWARGEELGDLSRAEHLFDWTVRNVAIATPAVDDDGKPLPTAPQVPWEALFYGRGTAWERAWVFVLLARQQGIDAAVISLGGSDASQPPRPWAVAVLTGDNAYLFDPVLGLPIPSKDGITLDGRAMRIKPATLAEVAADDGLLRQLDVDEEHPYPVKAEDVQRAVVLLEASPFYLSRRSRLLEARLTGAQKMVLTAHPTAQAERWKALKHVGDVRLWRQPYETLARRLQMSPREVALRLITLMPFYGEGGAVPLRTGRMLHLKGRFTEDRGATWWYQQARPANEDLVRRAQDEFQKALKRTQEALATLPPAERAARAAELQSRDAASIEVEVRMEQLAKQDASYWLGTMAFDRGDYRTAEDYFARRVDLAVTAPWAFAARYHLARTLEAMGRTDDALKLYRSEPPGPMHHGELLRARLLERVAGKP